ncbi:MAG: hypothetical protein IKO48_07175 [Elusimicrobia bacterium]|nr:hypothetical protein [Elusimicrobiota bacterium]
MGLEDGVRNIQRTRAGTGNLTVVSNPDNTNLEVKANTIYDFGDTPITELTITSAEKSYQESVIYFVTGGTITFSAPNTIKWGGDGSAPSGLELNTRYCISICNGLAEIDTFGTVS